MCVVIYSDLFEHEQFLVSSFSALIECRTFFSFFLRCGHKMLQISPNSERERSGIIVVGQLKWGKTSYLVSLFYIYIINFKHLKNVARGVYTVYILILLSQANSQSNVQPSHYSVSLSLTQQPSLKSHCL